MDNFEEIVNKLQEEERYDEVIDLCNKEIADNPKNAQAYYEKAWAEDSLRQESQALLDINKSINLLKNYLNLSLKGYILWRLNDKEGAIKIFEEALKQNSKSLEALDGICDCYYFKHDYENAIKYAKRILVISPNDAKAINRIGNIERKFRHFDIAIQTFIRAIESDPKREIFYWDLGNCYCDINKYDEAIKVYQKAIELDETYADAYWMIGNVYKYKRDLHTAIEYYTKAINLYPKGSPQLYFGDRAFAYKEIKEYDRALNDINTAIELDCSFAGSYYLKAGIEYEMNLNEAVIKDLKKSLECDKSFIPSYVALICIYSELKKYKEARKYLKQGLKIEPKNQELLKLKEELQQYTFLGKLKSFFKRK